MVLRQLIVFLSIMIVASIGFTPDATAKYRITVPLTDSLLEEAPTEPPVILAKGGKRPQAQFKQAGKKPVKRTKPTATLKKPIAGQRRPSVSQSVRDVRIPKRKVSVSGTASRAAVTRLSNSSALATGAIMRSSSKSDALEKAKQELSKRKIVIGKVRTLKSVQSGKSYTTLRDTKTGKNESTLLPRLPDQGGPRANWKQNFKELRVEMNKGVSIRDGSISRTEGSKLRSSNRGFLRAERIILKSKGMGV